MSENKRSIFTILGSFGPGGAIAILTEKVFRRIFPEGYALGDEHEFQAPEDTQIRKMRQDFVNELFDMKVDFEK